MPKWNPVGKWEKMLSFESDLAVIIAEILQKNKHVELKNPTLSAGLLVFSFVVLLAVYLANRRIPVRAY